VIALRIAYWALDYSDSFADGVLGLVLEVSSSLLSLGKNLVFRNALVSFSSKR